MRQFVFLLLLLDTVVVVVAGTSSSCSWAWDAALRRTPAYSGGFVPFLHSNGVDYIDHDVDSNTPPAAADRPVVDADGLHKQVASVVAAAAAALLHSAGVDVDAGG
eukprot:1016436_1